MCTAWNQWETCWTRSRILGLCAHRAHSEHQWKRGSPMTSSVLSQWELCSPSFTTCFTVVSTRKDTDWFYRMVRELLNQVQNHWFYVLTVSTNENAARRWHHQCSANESSAHQALRPASQSWANVNILLALLLTKPSRNAHGAKTAILWSCR